MFDEKSEVWIKIFKIYTVIMFWLFLLVGFILCTVAAWSEEFYITEVPFLDGIICLIIGAFVAFTQLVVNMLIIQFLNNVQLIREKVEKM